MLNAEICHFPKPIRLWLFCECASPRYAPLDGFQLSELLPDCLRVNTRLLQARVERGLYRFLTVKQFSLTHSLLLGNLHRFRVPGFQATIESRQLLALGLQSLDCSRLAARSLDWSIANLINCLLIWTPCF